MKKMYYLIITLVFLLFGIQHIYASDIFNNIDEPVYDYRQLGDDTHDWHYYLAQKFITSSTNYKISEVELPLYSPTSWASTSYTVYIYSGDTEPTTPIAQIGEGLVSSLYSINPGPITTTFSNLNIELEPNTIYWLVLSISDQSERIYWYYTETQFTLYDTYSIDLTGPMPAPPPPAPGGPFNAPTAWVTIAGTLNGHYPLMMRLSYNTPIPTVPEWGLIISGSLLALFIVFAYSKIYK